MATIGNSNLTLADLAAQAEPGGGKLSDIVEVLRQKQPILDDIPWVQCNDGSSHKSTIRTGLPTPTWRKLYGGIGSTKGTTAQVVDSCGMLEDLSEADCDLINMSADPGKARLNESRAHLQGMAHTMASTVFYGDQTSNPERFTGLAPRFNSLSAQNADNIVSGLGSGSDNTSIWLIDWDETTIHGLFPRGSTAGLKHTDEGEDWVLDSSDSTKKFKAYRDHYKWDAGLRVGDWRGVVRVPNIDVSDLGTIANTKNLITWMIEASERLDPTGKAVWYVNRTIREKLRLGILEKIANNLTFETVEGKRVMMFDGFEIKRCDAILNTEAAVA
jgi:hypothetical protein